MASKKPDQHDAGKSIRAAVAEWRLFAKIYNNHKMCPLMHDLLRVLFPGSDVKDKRALLARRIKGYNEFRESHPELNLPQLTMRDPRTGSIIGVPPGVLEQLEKFRIDKKKLQEAKGVIVTSAQFGTVLNESVWKSFKRYAEHLGYVLVVLPIKYGPVMTVYQKELDQRVLTSTFDPRLEGHMLFEDLDLAGGMLRLNTLRMRPTLMSFLPDAICERGGKASQIFAAPKLELTYRPRLQHDYPKAIMTTGAVTHPNYNVDNLGQQDRTGELAEAEHTFSAVIVEFSAKKTFHFRQLLATKEGEFYDIDPKRGGATLVTPNAIEHRPNDVTAAVLGDWHTGKTHPDVRDITFGDMLHQLNPKHVILHDLFDGDSISHWDKTQASRRAFKGPRQFNHLKLELDALIDELKWMQQQLPGAQLHVVASNHNEFLRRYIEDMRWSGEDQNLAIGAKLFSMMQEDMQRRPMGRHEISPTDPVNLWIREHMPSVRTHGRRDKLLLPEGPDSKKILVTLHGDVGPRGERASSLKTFRKWNQWIIIGHSHDAGILGPIWRVGTSTHLREHYVNGPATNWTHTHAIIFKNGQRMLLNIFNGTYHGQEKKRPRSAGLKPEGTEVRRRRRRSSPPSSPPPAKARRRRRKQR